MRAEQTCRYCLVSARAAMAILILACSVACSHHTAAAQEHGKTAEGSKTGDEKTTVRGTPAPLKMTCTVHGVANMTLQFVREAGAARTVEITGTNSGALWTVKIDGTDVTPSPQTSASPGQVNLHAGDKVTWTVTGSQHGIAFTSQADAQAVFTFDATMGQPLGASTAKPGFTWGTASFTPTTVLAVATVKNAPQ